MFYYVVERTGTGTDSDPYRPDIFGNPHLQGWVGGNDLGVDTYLVATPQSLKGRYRTLTEDELKVECQSRGYRFEDVLTWWVSGGIRNAIEIDPQPGKPHLA